jgi:hypothetical protein
LTPADFALRLLEGDFAEGDAVEVHAAGGELTFDKAKERKSTKEKPKAEKAAA